jgi:hypothetical protein
MQMTQEEIGEAEGHVVAVVTEREGREALETKIAALREELGTCAAKGFGADACYAPGQQVLHYGPAGVALIPVLERLMTSDLH